MATASPRQDRLGTGDLADPERQPFDLEVIEDYHKSIAPELREDQPVDIDGERDQLLVTRADRGGTTYRKVRPHRGDGSGRVVGSLVRAGLGRLALFEEADGRTVFVFELNYQTVRLVGLGIGNRDDQTYADSAVSGGESLDKDVVPAGPLGIELPLGIYNRVG